MDAVCAGQKLSAQRICERSGKRRGADGQRKFFQDIPANRDLAADRTAVANAVMPGFQREIERGAEHDRQDRCCQQQNNHCIYMMLFSILLVPLFYLWPLVSHI